MKDRGMKGKRWRKGECTGGEWNERRGDEGNVREGNGMK